MFPIELCLKTVPYRAVFKRLVNLLCVLILFQNSGSELCFSFVAVVVAVIVFPHFLLSALFGKTDFCLFVCLFVVIILFWFLFYFRPDRE